MEDRDAKLSRLQDVLDQVVSGRTTGHLCPFCGQSELEAKVSEDKFFVRLECPGCGQFFEGELA